MGRLASYSVVQLEFKSHKDILCTLYWMRGGRVCKEFVAMPMVVVGKIEERGVP